jgi:hypothetical protein
MLSRNEVEANPPQADGVVGGSPSSAWQSAFLGIPQTLRSTQGDRRLVLESYGAHYNTNLVDNKLLTNVRNSSRGLLPGFFGLYSEESYTENNGYQPVTGALPGATA